MAAPGLVGAVLHHAYLVFDLGPGSAGSGTIVFVSNPVGLEILP